MPLLIAFSFAVVYTSSRKTHASNLLISMQQAYWWRTRTNWSWCCWHGTTVYSSRPRAVCRDSYPRAVPPKWPSRPSKCRCPRWRPLIRPCRRATVTRRSASRRLRPRCPRLPLDSRRSARPTVDPPSTPTASLSQVTSVVYLLLFPFRWIGSSVHWTRVKYYTYFFPIRRSLLVIAHVYSLICALFSFTLIGRSSH